MHELIPKELWIGNALEGRNPRLLFDSEIRAVVDFAYEEAPATPPREIVYLRIPLVDGEGNDPKTLKFCIGSVLSLLTMKTPTLVMCSAGMSRSPCIATAALSHFLQQDANGLLRELSETQPLDVSPGLWNAVLSLAYTVD